MIQNQWMTITLQLLSTQSRYCIWYMHFLWPTVSELLISSILSSIRHLALSGTPTRLSCMVTLMLMLTVTVTLGEVSPGTLEQASVILMVNFYMSECYWISTIWHKYLFQTQWRAQECLDAFKIKALALDRLHHSLTMWLQLLLQYLRS